MMTVCIISNYYRYTSICEIFINTSFVARFHIGVYMCICSSIISLNVFSNGILLSCMSPEIEVLCYIV